MARSEHRWSHGTVALFVEKDSFDSNTAPRSIPLARFYCVVVSDLIPCVVDRGSLPASSLVLWSNFASLTPLFIKPRLDHSLLARHRIPRSMIACMASWREDSRPLVRRVMPSPLKERKLGLESIEGGMEQENTSGYSQKQWSWPELMLLSTRIFKIRNYKCIRGRCCWTKALDDLEYF